jgi:hypothetical protein
MDVDHDLHLTEYPWTMDRNAMLDIGQYQLRQYRGEEAIVSSTFPELNLTAAIVLGA